MKSFALAIVGAEYVLRWLPKGTHKWERFVMPEELARMMRRNGMRVIDRAGVVYNPLAGKWRLSSDTDVNYIDGGGEGGLSKAQAIALSPFVFTRLSNFRDGPSGRFSPRSIPDGILAHVQVMREDGLRDLLSFAQRAYFGGR